MKFKESKYYNKEFLGKNLYDLISDDDEVLTVQEFFNINNVQNEYDIKGLLVNYNLKIYDDYYEFNCQSHKEKLYLVFDKPVRITGEYCIRVIAPEIIIVEKSTSNNYTPHDVVVMNQNGETLHVFPSASVARCTVKQAEAGSIDNIPVVKQEYGEVEGLPQEEDGVYYIVSFLVQDALPHRKDLLVPANLIRDEKGVILGCTAFSIKNK